MQDFELPYTFGQPVDLLRQLVKLKKLTFDSSKGYENFVVSIHAVSVL